MCLSPPLLLISFVNAALLTVSTFAGDGTGQSTDGDGIAARFNGPYAIKSNASGYLFVADYSGYKIRVISPSGLVSTLAGNGNYGYTNGNAASAAFSYPSGLCLDTTGNVYVADYNNHCIRMISLDGTVSTFVGSLTGTSGTTNAVGTSAKFNYPTDCEFDSQGNMYVVDSSNHRIRKVTPSGSVTTLVGGLAGFLDANGTDARFTYPYNLVISPSDDLYIAENVNRRIRKVTLDGVVTTLAGDGSQAVVDGTGTSASFDAPQGIAFGPSGDLYVVEGLQHRVRKVTLSGVVTTIAGTVSGYINGDETVARLRNPTGLAFNSSGVLFIADFNNNRIRQITFVTTTAVSTTLSSTAISTTVSTTVATSSESPTTTSVPFAYVTSQSSSEPYTTLTSSSLDSTTLTSSLLVSATQTSSTAAFTTQTSSLAVSATQNSSSATLSVSSVTTLPLIASSVSSTRSSTVSVTISLSPSPTTSSSATGSSVLSAAPLSTSSASSQMSAPASFTTLPVDASLPPPASPLWWIVLPVGAGAVGSAAFAFYRRRRASQMELPQ